MAASRKPRKATTRKSKPSKMNPELQRKIARIASDLETTLINLRVQADQVYDDGDLEHGTPADIVKMLAREAERQLAEIRELAGDY